MYLQHFGLREQPFSATPDPRFLYCSAQHAEALAGLHYGLCERRGLLVLIARPGMGKTTLLRHLLERWSPRASTAFVLHPPETREQMIAAVLEDLGLAPAGSYPESRRLLCEHALECHRRGKRLLIAFDEAQGIPLPVLEEIRLLTNFETSEEKLVEVVVAGQPALFERLQAPDCEQLRQRVSVWTRLRELDRWDVGRYIEHRLRAAGRKRGRVFTRRAVTVVAQTSQGVPRNVNAVCFQALSSAFAEGKRKVGEQHVRSLAQPLSGWISGYPVKGEVQP